MADLQAPNNRLSGLVRRSMDRASSVLKLVPFDKKEKDADAPSTKKEHRRAQVRRAQIEHRQRKETHIKSLEQEVSSLRDLIGDVEDQSRTLKLENQAIRCALTSARSSQLNQLPFVSPQAHHYQPAIFSFSANDQEFGLTPTTYPFDTAATVIFDEMMNASCLQLTRGTEFGCEKDAMMIVPAEVAGLKELTIQNDEMAVAAGLGSTPDHTMASGGGEWKGKKGGLLTEEIYAAHQDPEVALRAINFILALEHPCRTHFLPKNTSNPHPDLPIQAENLHSGHEMMASTHLYIHAPLPVFQNMHAHTHSPPSTFSPTALPPPTLTPSWKVPAHSSTDELMKLYEMSTSLSKEDWEITPVQAWFLLVERVGVRRFTNEGGERELEQLKGKLGELAKCFGFGAVLSKALFWNLVGEVFKLLRIKYVGIFS